MDDALGSFPGALPLSAINLKGLALTPHPSIVVNFRSYATGCDKPVMCAVNIADSGLQQGQGMHGSFSRADTMNFMAAIGPSFKAGYVNEAPVSNADIGMTIAKVLGLKISAKGTLVGRVIEEALPGGTNPAVERFVERGNPRPQRTCDHSGRSACRPNAILRRCGISRPHCRDGRAPSRKPLIAEILPEGKCFSIRCLSVKAFVPHDRRSAAH